MISLRRLLPLALGLAVQCLIQACGTAQVFDGYATEVALDDDGRTLSFQPTADVNVCGAENSVSVLEEADAVTIVITTARGNGDDCGFGIRFVRLRDPLCHRPVLSGGVEVNVSGREEALSDDCQ